MIPWQGVLVSGHGHIGHIVQNALYFFIKISSLHMGRDRTNFSVKMSKVYNSKYENSKFQDPLGQRFSCYGVAILILKICKSQDP